MDGSGNSGAWQLDAGTHAILDGTGLTVGFARFSLYVVASVFLILGAMSLVAPTVLTPLVEIALPTRIAVMEVRGVYGGFFIGIGVFFFLCARRDDWLRLAARGASLWRRIGRLVSTS